MSYCAFVNKSSALPTEFGSEIKKDHKAFSSITLIDSDSGLLNLSLMAKYSRCVKAAIIGMVAKQQMHSAKSNQVPKKGHMAPNLTWVNP